MSYPLFLYELRYVRSPVVPGLTVLGCKVGLEWKLLYTPKNLRNIVVEGEKV
jgi:hypothetical protein